MANNKKQERLKKVERVKDILNQALCQALEKYKQNKGKLPEFGYSVCLEEGMTYEEELQEIVYALVRFGSSEEEARENAPVELQRMYEKMDSFEKPLIHLARDRN